MSRPVKALLLDDDVWAQKMLRDQLRRNFPELIFELRSEPDPRGEFDLYFIDNEFDGKPFAGTLARDIRARRPGVLIIAFSATMDANILKELINAGCDGVCDKSVPEDLPVAMEIVEGYVKALSSAPPERRGFLGAIQSIAQLLREWNSRLERQERSLRS